MTRHHFGALSAFFDGERVSAEELLAGFQQPGALEFLEQLARLRSWVQQDAAVPSASWHRAMRRTLARADARRSRVCAAERRARRERVTTPTVRHTAIVGQSTRQAEILTCLLEGLSEKGVADRLLLSLSTVHSHIKHLHPLLSKLAGTLGAPT